MSDCDRLRDRLAEVRAEAELAPEERAHLAECAGCAAEWALLGAARRLGGSAGSIDPDRIAARVRERLAAAPVADEKVVPFRRRWARWGIGLAAAAALVLVVRSAVDRSPAADVAVATEPAVLTELDGLTGTELETVLAELEAAPGTVEVPGMGDLTVEELERVLRAWES